MTKKPQEFAPTPRITGDSSDPRPREAAGGRKQLLDNPTWAFKAKIDRGGIDWEAFPASMRPKPPKVDVPAVLDVAPPRPNRARLAAYNREGGSVEQLTLQEDAEYSATLARRRDLKHALDTMPAGVLANENSFYEDERIRHGAALNLLRRGYPVLQISIATGLTPDEVRAIKENR